MTQKKIVCVGSIMVDMLCPVDHLPASGEGLVAKDALMALGGCTYNTARIIRQAGGDATLLAPVGEGPFAHFVRTQLEAEGITPWTINEGIDSGAALCLLEPDGERTMITFPGIERCFRPAWFDCFDASAFDIIEMCGYELAGESGKAIVGFAEQNPHLQVVFAPGPTITQLDAELIARINALRPIWHLNCTEALSYTGAACMEDAGKAIAAACANAVIITKGAHGCWLFKGESMTHVPTKSTTPVDTTGAGDSHVGALLAKRAQGASWEEALEFANAVAGAVCQTIGAGVPDETIAAIAARA